MQVAPQHTQSPVSSAAYAVDSHSSSRRQYSSPQSGDAGRNRSTSRTTTSPQNSQRPMRRPNPNAPQSSSPNNPHQVQYQSVDSQPLSPSVPHTATSSSTMHASPTVPTSVTSAPYTRSRREQQETGGPIPPPRTSSNQRGSNINAISTASQSERNPTSRSVGRAPDQPSLGDGRQLEDRESGYTEDYSVENRYGRSKDDPSTAAAAAARSRRRGPISSEGPQRVRSTRESGAQSSPAAVQSQSASNSGPATPPPNILRGGSEVINRVVITDPQVDVIREQERQAEAVPSASGNSIKSEPGLDLVGNEGVDDGGRGGGQSRQDYSSSTARRKEIKFGEYVLGQTLGEGEFGKVKLGWKKDGSVQVAIKLIRRESLGTNPSRLPKIYREIAILEKLSHPNIVRLHEMVETDRHIGIILEYASGGELFDYILTHRYLKDNAARRLFAQLVSGVGYLHKKGIVHRDLKLENLLLDRNRNIIITDFGFANTFDPRDELNEEVEYNLTNRDYVKRQDLERVQANGSRRGDLMQTSCGSPCYAAPELVVTDSLYTGRKVDVWSCGVILYAMLAGYLPFDDDPANPEGDNINLLYKYIVSTPLTFPEYVTPHARDLLRRILVPDPRKRADLFEVARHSWLSDYAHVVAHVTSSTTSVGEIANNAANSDPQDVPLLARSASVREPTKINPSNISPVGGLSHQGRIDPEQPPDKAKPPRDSKRRTVQVEYVAPQSQTTRGEASLSTTSPAAMESPINMVATSARTRVRAESQGPVEIQGQSSEGTSMKPLPQEPSTIQDARTGQPYLGANRTQQRPVSSQQGMAPPARPTREIPRSVSDSTGAFGQAPTIYVPRPTTGGSMASSNVGRLPSRGNSYSQPLAPTVAATNAQGRLAQPKNGKQYNISAPIPQSQAYPSDPSLGYSGTHTNSSQKDQSRGHKRSNTLGSVFSRPVSIFGAKAPTQGSQSNSRQQAEKKYPPTSMKTPMASDTPRQSSDSRRPSFGFGRKNSDLGKQDKPKRFSLLPASFSFKNFTGSAKDQPMDYAGPVAEQRHSTLVQQAPANRGQSRPQGTAFGRGQSRSNSYSTDNSPPAGYDGQRDRHRENPVQQTRRVNPVVRKALSPQQAQQAQHGSEQYVPQQELYIPSKALQPGQSYLLGESGPPTPSENAVGVSQRHPQYPPGFDSYDDEARQSMERNRNGRGPGVLQKNNRKFADAYEQEQEPGYGAGGYHAGSSGAAKRVMDFFRRRGKARAGDDR